MLRSATEKRTMRILLPVDGSATAMAAVRHVLHLMTLGLAADVVLVNVQEPPTLYEVVVAHDAQVLEHVRSDAGADLLAQAEALLDSAEVSWQSEVAGGQPAAMILELLENYGCDAVVMGAVGAGHPHDRTALGSVAQAVLEHSPVPVTVVREPSLEAAAAADADDSDAEKGG
jgi:nucleotide-binding universal stress UspA family protein